MIGRRKDIATDVLSDNPGSRSRIDETIVRAYRRARIEAARKSGLDEAAISCSCPYSFDDITSRPPFSR
jgi:hypothetical protein